MMVNPYDDSHLMLALQIDHSRVAGFFAAHWGNQEFDRPEPYASVVLAANEHDSGWWEWEMKPSTLNDRGFPMDYHDGSLKYLGQLRLDFYKNAVDPRAATRSLCGAFNGDAWRRAHECRLRQVRISAGSHFRPARQSLRRSSGTAKVQATRAIASIGPVQKLCLGRTGLDQLRIHGGLRPTRPIRLQPLSVKQ